MCIMNNILIISNKPERLESFIKYYNIFNEPTDIVLNVILDDRYQTYDLSDTIKDNYNIYYASDAVKQLVPRLSDPETAEIILDKFRLSIKLLVILYAHEVLGMEKVCMMDDDTFLIQPIDSYFENDYVFYNERVLGRMSVAVENLMTGIYSDLVDVHKMNTKPHFTLNSGQVIHTKNPNLFKFIDRAFCSDLLNVVCGAIEKYKSKKNYLGNIHHRPIGGKYWIMEQNVYAVYFRWLTENGYAVKEFPRNEFKLYEGLLKPNYTMDRIRKLPKFLHYLPTDKSPLYDTVAKQLDRIINKEIHVPR